MEERIRVVVAGPGPADEDRVAEILARALRDAGVEVVYTDRPQTPEQLVATVVQEDADAVGIVLAEGDVAPLARVAGLMAERGIDDVLVFAGGVAPADAPTAAGDGVARVFPRDAAPDEVVDWVCDRLRG
ncbi:methylmalonyl-CoA mutase, C-terminal domain [Blastococcus aggregatus]|uniref:Methylmalonyl-CoA mutase, C-terminal domain n=1 Tax=Blastococcus aggregatus TaxID=38502 RepID=A0A285V4J6_9ACTN|nr:cobalamin-dependent protein [Blastococcus aggregatus]SOC49032.1 methylmalonyl-CoA mutase, C-terminal domain [Blastococcus aggregatus]